MNKISIIILIYNVEQYLPQCLDSIINQTYKNLEIILINDGSTDNSGKICDNYAKVDNRIHVFHKKNEGVSSARNLGLDKCTGDFIGFVDPDDFIELNMYEILYNEQQRTNADIVWCNYLLYYSANNQLLGEINSNIVYNLLNIKQKNKFYSDLFYKYHMKAYLVNKLYKKELLSNLKFPYKKSFEDLFIFISLINQANIISFTNKNLYYYRQRKNSICYKNSTQSVFNFDMIEAYIKSSIDYAYFSNNKKISNILFFKSYLYALKNILFYQQRNLYKSEEKYIINKLKSLLKTNISIKNKFTILRITYFPNLYRKIKLLKHPNLIKK